MSENTARGPVEPPEGRPEFPGGSAPGPASSYQQSSHQPAAAGTFRVGEALRFAWEKFKGNPLVWILLVLLLVVVGTVFNSGNISQYQETMRDIDDMSTTQVDTGLTFGSSLLSLIGAILAGILQGMGVSTALREVGGEKPTFASLFRPANLGMIVVAALLLLAAQFVGALLCGVGLIVVAIFAVFTYHGVADQGLNAWAAFTASWRLVGRNFGAVFLLELALLGINILGAIPCGLGLLITTPLTFIALSFAYRRLAGGPVAA